MVDRRGEGAGEKAVIGERLRLGVAQRQERGLAERKLRQVVERRGFEQWREVGKV